MSSLDRLRDLGYTVEQTTPATDQHPTVYFVAGFGVATYVADDDYDTQRSLIDSHDASQT